MSAEEISKYIGLKPHTIRDIASQLHITKRIISNDIYPNDTWVKPIYPNADFTNYEVSKEGHVRRKDNHIIIQPSVTKDGYYEIKLVDSLNNKRKTIKLHRLVAYTFIIFKFNFQTEVNHKNGIKSDNSVDNLEWVTPSENQKHSYANSFRTPANMVNTMDDIHQVCIWISEGKTNDEIISLADFNISRDSLSNIRNKRTYKNISNNYF